VTLRTIGTKEKSLSCKLHYKRIDTSVNLASLNEMFSKMESPSILGGNEAKADADGFSYWAADPKEIFEFRSGGQNPFEKLQLVLGKYKPEKDHIANLPKGIFCGGWIGYFSYEFGRYIEVLPQTAVDNLKMPLIRLCFYDKILCYDHNQRCFRLVVLELPDDIKKPEEKLDSLEKILTESQKVQLPKPVAADIENTDFSGIRCNMDKEYYLRQIGKIRRYIYDGIVYQVNFSQRFNCDFNAMPIELYHWQNHYNPSGYAAYIDSGDFTVVSASPEMFITLTDRIISTKPIKGTRPRLADTNENNKINRKNSDGLLHSKKEKAELNMIIDLERNDIAKICEPGTRKVVQQLL
jgi:para-aminobenzoate synthetase component 1